MKLPRRKFLHLAAGAAALPAVSRFAWAQAYPTRPVHVIVGFTAGNNIDIVARLIGQWLSERLGQPFIIENRPGASGNIAAEAVVRAPADGHTLLMTGTFNAINATLYENLSFNFIRDIAPVASLSRTAGVMEVNLSFPAKTVPEFIAYAKANPRTVMMASAGPGSAAGLYGELFKSMAGVDLPAVNYRGTPAALSHGRPRPRDIRPDCIIGRLYQGRSAASLGRDDSQTHRGIAGRSNDRRICAGLRGERLAGDRRASEHAAADHCHPQ
jgi:tripartite-type tricarboxylate transporter receptor subunit TctC